jgi:hypothetical protein
MTKDQDPRRSCREGQERETEREPGLESNLSDWPSQHNRSGSPGPSFTRFDCGFKAVVLTILSSYLGAQQGCRNEAAVTILARIGTLTMTTFDKREEGFEKKFALDEELKFKAEARRDKLLGLWVAEKLGLSGEAANDYARTVVAADFQAPGDADVVRKVMDDLAAKGIAISESELRAKMDELMAQAIMQVKAGT